MQLKAIMLVLYMKRGHIDGEKECIHEEGLGDVKLALKNPHWRMCGEKYFAHSVFQVGIIVSLIPHYYDGFFIAEDEIIE